ncbi:MAG: NIL domain-containing protein [Thermodesulfobacteriota bacterium]
MHTRIFILRFPKDTSDQPIIYRLVKQYDVQFNILKADILPQREGLMILELKGSKESVQQSLEYVKEFGVAVQRLAATVGRDDEKCFQCGACTGICPVGALALNRPSMEVVFSPDKCTGCGLCVPVCPVRAMEVSLSRNLLTEEAAA